MKKGCAALVGRGWLSLKTKLTLCAIVFFSGFLAAADDWRAGDQDLLFLSDFTVPPIPEIVSAPPTSVDVGFQYQYQVEAVDPEGYSLTFRLIDAPESMTIDRSSGLVQWQADQSGTFSIELEVRNPL